MDELFLLLDLFDDLLGPLCVICLTCYIAATTGLFARHTHTLPRAVDAVLAAATVVGSIGLLHQIERLTNLTLFDGKMVGSAVVFCTNQPNAASAFGFLGIWPPATCRRSGRRCGRRPSGLVSRRSWP